MFVEVKEFVGWTNDLNVRKHTVSDFSGGHKVFELEASKALFENMDVFQVTLWVDDTIQRELVFRDRRFARLD